MMILVGLINIVSGVVGLWRILAPRLKRSQGPRVKGPAILTRLFVAQLVLNVTTIMFGLSAFVATLIPGLVLGVILSVNGGILLYMLYILVILDRMQSETRSSEAPA